jgi:ABC-type multidrug transport system ATPase subunit
MRIALESVSKKYGRVIALNPTTLHFDGGQVIAVLGSNGAGKTTLLRCLSTISAPSRGQILWDGEPLTRSRLDLRRRLMFMPDFPPLFGHLTVLQHLALVLDVHGCESRGREDDVVGVLRDLDLLTLCDTPVQQLSRGQGYKAALAALLLIQPDLWLIDEPFASGMDPNGISVFKRCARQAAQSGKLVIYSTQIIDIAETLSDKVCVIHKGDVRAFASVESLATEARREEENGVLEEILQKLREEER